MARTSTPHGGRRLDKTLWDLAQTGNESGHHDPDQRLTHRNGYRERRWDTRVGTIDLSIPRARDGSYFLSLLEPRRRAERALLAVVQEA